MNDGTKLRSGWVVVFILSGDFTDERLYSPFRVVFVT